jgi:hypothetical protein
MLTIAQVGPRVVESAARGVFKGVKLDDFYSVSASLPAPCHDFALVGPLWV